MSEINNTLNERGERYGKFKDVASTTYALQEILRDAKSYKHMSDDQVIALDMICNKIARAEKASGCGTETI